MVEIQDGLIVPAKEPSKGDIEKQVRTFENGARWFYWIAGLSLVNSVVGLWRGDFGFVIGLGITQMIDSIASVATEETPEVGLIVRVMALTLDVVFAGIFVLFGWLACRRKGWAFVVGMVLYSLDGLLFLLIGDFLSLGFHGFALVCILSGYVALRKLKEVQPATIDMQEVTQLPDESV